MTNVKNRLSMVTKRKMKMENQSENLVYFETLGNQLEILDPSSKKFKENEKQNFSRFLGEKITKKQEYEKGAVHLFCAESLSFVRTTAENLEDRPLLLMYRPEESVYSNYLKYCQQNQIKAVGKSKFGREINSYLRETYDIKNPDDFKIIKNNTLYLKDFILISMNPKIIEQQIT